MQKFSYKRTLKSYIKLATVLMAYNMYAARTYFVNFVLRKYIRLKLLKSCVKYIIFKTLGKRKILETLREKAISSFPKVLNFLVL